MLCTLQDLSDLPQRLKNAFLVVCNFDGVHRGHRDLLQKATKLAAEFDRNVVAVTFDPHPKTLIDPATPFLQLTAYADKERLLKEAGADEVVTLAFNAELAALPPPAFVEQVLIAAFEPAAILTIANFRFGNDGSDTAVEILRAAGARRIPVRICPLRIDTESGEAITAAAIRARLAVGDVKTANRLLGRRWTVEGLVVHGDKRGRQLGFPTANLAPLTNANFGFGVYAVRVLVGDKIHNGVACYGTRPQFDDGAPRIEIHILDFTGDIYGERILVEFAAYHRSERTFASVEALKQQIDHDCLATRQLLASDFEDPEVESTLPRRALRLEATDADRAQRSSVII